jgi:hypothetical protein
MGCCACTLLHKITALNSTVSFDRAMSSGSKRVHPVCQALELTTMTGSMSTSWYVDSCNDGAVFYGMSSLGAMLPDANMQVKVIRNLGSGAGAQSRWYYKHCAVLKPSLT